MSRYHRSYELQAGYYDAYCEGDFCLTINCGNIAELTTGYCSICRPIPHLSLLPRCYLWSLRGILKLIGA